MIVLTSNFLKRLPRDKRCREQRLFNEFTLEARGDYRISIRFRSAYPWLQINPDHPRLTQINLD